MVRKFALWTCLLAVAAGLAGCDATPSTEKLRLPTNPSRAFIVSESNIRGLFGNYDVDSAVYTYESGAQNEEAFWSSVGDQARDADWQLADTHAKYRRYVRIRPKTAEQVFHSAEEVRVAFDPDSKAVVIAWAQADLHELPDDFPRDGEGEFVRRVVWPRFDEEVARFAAD